MTTSIDTMTLFSACSQAGPGGVVTREGDVANYVVGVDNSGNYTLSCDGGPAEPRRTFVEDGWSVGRPESTEAQPITVGEYFRLAGIYSIHRSQPGGSRDYVFYSINDDGVTIFDMTWGDKLVLSPDELHRESLWIPALSDGDPRYLDSFARMLLVSRADADLTIASQQKRISELETSSEAYVSDFKAVNQFINDYANTNDMCSDYERRIFGWNEELSTLKLVGRERDYGVTVEILGEDYNFSVSAGSPKEASEKAAQMSNGDLIREITHAGYDFSNLEFVVRPNIDTDF